DTLAVIALDLSRKEGDLAAYTADELKEELTRRGLGTIAVMDKGGNGLSAGLKAMDQGVKLWKWFILAALFFLLLEIPLIRIIR
ncbi:MAG: hypothetical protein KDB93_00705, partial [Flavobacteriales bacterium]|nr:hypothetical protein [Flavobacteriales bacterium]